MQENLNFKYMHLIGCIIDKPNRAPDRENMKNF